MRKLWQQFHKEPDDSYSRFTLYKGLGPGRSVLNAYRAYASTFQNSTVGKKRHSENGTATEKTGGPDKVPGYWGEECSRWRWVERAEAWDVHVLRNYGERLATRFIGTLDRIADKVAIAVADPEIQPKNWKEILEALTLIAQYLKPDIVREPRNDTDSEPDRQPELVGSSVE